MEEKKSAFEILNAINVNDKTEKKNNGKKDLTYLSWTWAIAEVTKRFPDVQYEIHHWDGKPYLYDESLGYMVETSMTIGGQTKVMWLPVMDSHNAAMKDKPYEVKTKYSSYTVQAATMTDINKTIMRCLTKNIAMFGLGLYIFAGEDLPEDQKQEAKPEDQKQEEAAKQVENEVVTDQERNIMLMLMEKHNMSTDKVPEKVTKKDYDKMMRALQKKEKDG